MDIRGLAVKLRAEEGGLFFLAGLDADRSEGEHATLTIHAAEGTVNPEYEESLKKAVAESDPDMGFRLCLHNSEELYAPDSLEAFARLFRHDHIVADPTGAFTRVPELVELAQTVSESLGLAVRQTLWQAEFSTMAFVVDPSVADHTLAGESAVPEAVRDAIEQLVDEYAGPDLRKAIRIVRVTTQVPAGKYVPIDNLSAPPKPAEAGGFFKPAGIVAALAAFIGFGLVPAAAATSPIDDRHVFAPGITALAGLTTLGENSLGNRNHYQAVGGLRLYFGEAGVAIVAAYGPGSEQSNSTIQRLFAIPGLPKRDKSESEIPSDIIPGVKKPIRIQSAS